MESESRQQPEVNPKDTQAIKEVINKVKSQGLFDQFRKECLADVDTKPAYHNLIQRVEKFVERFLNGQKWNSNVNKNQLRETLRRQLNNSGVMSIGVDRIIEQVVNPKILLGIKPKVDEAVCGHLGIDLKARQEEQQKHKQEQQRLMLQQQQLQQQHLQTLINQNVKAEDAFGAASGMVPTPNHLPWSRTSTDTNVLGASASGMTNTVAGAPGITNPVTGIPINPPMGFGGMIPPFFMGGWPPRLPGMEGVGPGAMHPAIPGQPMIPGHPMIPAFGGGGLSPAVAGITPFTTAVSPAAGSGNATFSTPPIPTQSTPGHDFSKPPPGLAGTPMLSSASSVSSSPGIPGLTVQSSPVAPPGVLATSGASLIRPPPPGSVPPPPGTVPVIPPTSLITPTTTVCPLPTTPTIPALISHTLSKVSKEDLTPEKIAVFKTAAAFITKTVSNAQGNPTADLATMFSPRVLAEAMMEESGKPMTKHEIRAAKRKERMKEYERLKAEREKEEEKQKILGIHSEDKEDPLPPRHNLMDVFQAAEDVSDDEEALDLLMDIEEEEDRNKRGIVLSEDSDKERDDQPPTNQPGKRYNFAWDVDKDPGELSDVAVSSVHTSDISSFEELSASEDEDESGTEEYGGSRKDANDESQSAEELHPSESDVPHENEVSKAKDVQTLELPLSDTDEKETVANGVASVDVTETKDIESQFAPDVVPLIPPITSVSSYKPSKPDTTKPRKLLSLSYKYSDSEDEESREERKARIAREKEERYLKRQQRRADMEAKRKEREEEKARLREEKKRQKEQKQSESLEESKSQSTADGSLVEDLNASTASAEPDSPTKQTTSRRRKNKAEMKEQLHQQKVLERKAALRRQRTRNRKYASDEFTSIFSEKKALSQSYTDPVVVGEEIVTFDGAVEVVEECVVVTVGEEVETTTEIGAEENRTDNLMLQCPSPYSDISDRSMSEKSEEENKTAVEMEEVSSDEDLVTGEEPPGDESSKSLSSSMQTLDSAEGVTQEVSAEKTAPESNACFTRLATRSKSDMSLDDGDSLNDGEGNRVSPVQPEMRSWGQALDKDDLYKPGSSQRQESTPPPAFTSDARSPKAMSSGLSDDDEQTSHQSSEVSRQVSQSYGMVEISKEGTEEVATERDGAASPKEPIDIMGNLELEPVSDEESPLDDLSTGDNLSDGEKEEGEDKTSDKDEKILASSSNTGNVAPVVEVTKASSKDDEASDEGEIKSDSDEAEERANVERERSAKRTPIQFVDFGEAEKRARGSRSYYTEPQQDRRPTRGLTVSSGPPTSYRTPYTSWSQGDTNVHSQFTSSSARYTVPHEGIAPARVKSPMGVTYDGGESEASSQSRSSVVRQRDDVPPPYPIEGVSRKHRSPASDHGSSSLFKALSPPSPVSSSSSSSSSSRSSHSRAAAKHSRSKSRSRSRSSSSSSSSRSSHHKRKAKRSKKRRKKSPEREKSASLHSHSVSSRLSGADRNHTPDKPLEQVPPIPLSNQPRERHLSSGHESISSDELPYFPDEEPQTVPAKAKKRSRSRSSASSHNSSSSPRAKRKRQGGSPGNVSISSSELIYSPTRRKVSAELSDNARDDDEVSIERPPMSPGRSSISSGELPDYPGDEPDPALMQGFSPHQPPLPSDLPPLPEDTDGFQPPLPQDSPPLPAGYPPPPPPDENDVLPPPPESNWEAQREEGELAESRKNDHTRTSQQSVFPTASLTSQQTEQLGSTGINSAFTENVSDSSVGTSVSGSVTAASKTVDTSESFRPDVEKIVTSNRTVPVVEVFNVSSVRSPEGVESTPVPVIPSSPVKSPKDSESNSTHVPVIPSSPVKSPKDSESNCTHVPVIPSSPVKSPKDSESNSTHVPVIPSSPVKSPKDSESNSTHVPVIPSSPVKSTKDSESNSSHVPVIPSSPVKSTKDSESNCTHVPVIPSSPVKSTEPDNSYSPVKSPEDTELHSTPVRIIPSSPVKSQEHIESKVADVPVIPSPVKSAEPIIPSSPVKSPENTEFNSTSVPVIPSSPVKLSEEGLNSTNTANISSPSVKPSEESNLNVGPISALSYQAGDFPATQHSSNAQNTDDLSVLSTTNTSSEPADIEMTVKPEISTLHDQEEVTSSSLCHSLPAETSWSPVKSSSEASVRESNGMSNSPHENIVEELNPATPEPPQLAREGISPKKVSPLKSEGAQHLEAPSLSMEPVPLPTLSPQQQALVKLQASEGEPPLFNLPGSSSDQGHQKTLTETVGDSCPSEVARSDNCSEENRGEKNSSGLSGTFSTADKHSSSDESFSTAASYKQIEDERTLRGSPEVPVGISSSKLTSVAPSSDDTQNRDYKEPSPNSQSSETDSGSVHASSVQDTFQPGSSATLVASPSEPSGDAPQKSMVELESSSCAPSEHNFTTEQVSQSEAENLELSGLRSVSPSETSEGRGSANSPTSSNEDSSRRGRKRKQNTPEAEKSVSSSAGGSPGTQRPGTRLQQQQQQELSKPQTRGRSNSLPSARESRSKKESEKSPPMKKQKK